MTWLTYIPVGVIAGVVGWKYRNVIKKKIVKIIIRVLKSKERDVGVKVVSKNNTYEKIGNCKWKRSNDNIVVYSEERPEDSVYIGDGSILLVSVIHADGNETDITEALIPLNHGGHNIPIPLGDIYSLRDYESIQFVFNNGNITEFSSNKECVSI
jgi:hypothetical protein